MGRGMGGEARGHATTLPRPGFPEAGELPTALVNLKAKIWKEVSSEIFHWQRSTLPGSTRKRTPNIPYEHPKHSGLPEKARLKDPRRIWWKGLGVWIYKT